MPTRAQPGRHSPARGVHIQPAHPTILFVTVCAIRPSAWLATDHAHQLLLSAWRAADTWLVGYYLLMPDHLHLFCSPRDLRFTVEKWAAYWKSFFTRRSRGPRTSWQRSLYHRRLRTPEEYREKWDYVRQNPFRKNLVNSPSDPWPYSGNLHPLPW